MMKLLPPVEEEIRRVIRNERAKDAAYRSVRFWGHGRPGRGVTPSARPATSLRSAETKRRPAPAMRRKLRCMSGEACPRQSGVDVKRTVGIKKDGHRTMAPNALRVRPNTLHSKAYPWK